MCQSLPLAFLQCSRPPQTPLLVQNLLLPPIHLSRAFLVSTALSARPSPSCAFRAELQPVPPAPSGLLLGRVFGRIYLQDRRCVSKAIPPPLTFSLLRLPWLASRALQLLSSTFLPQWPSVPLVVLHHSTSSPSRRISALRARIHQQGPEGHSPRILRVPLYSPRLLPLRPLSHLSRLPLPLRPRYEASWLPLFSFVS